MNVSNYSTSKYQYFSHFPHSLPIIGISGSRGKTTTSWILQQIFSTDGAETGSWTSSGVYFGDRALAGELGPWERVIFAARFGELDVLTQELASMVSVATGLPKQSYPIAVCTTICGGDESCAVGLSTQREQQALKLLKDAVPSQGLIIGNADDLLIVRALEDSASHVTFFALHPANPVLQHHLYNGGHACWVDDDWIMYKGDHSIEFVVRLSSIPATLDGAITYQVQNVLAAVAVARGLGIESAVIAKALWQFFPNPIRQPGATNIIERKSTRIIVEEPQSVWPLRMLIRGINQLPVRRTMIISDGFPTFRPGDAFEAGRIIGHTTGIILLHGECTTNEQVERVKDGISQSEFPPLVLLQPDEAAAARHMQNRLDSDDVALILTSNPKRLLTEIAPAAHLQTAHYPH